MFNFDGLPLFSVAFFLIIIPLASCFPTSGFCLWLFPLAFSARATGKSNRLEQQGVMGKLLLLHLSSWGTVARATGKGNR